MLQRSRSLRRVNLIRKRACRAPLKSVTRSLAQHARQSSISPQEISHMVLSTATG